MIHGWIAVKVRLVIEVIYAAGVVYNIIKEAKHVYWMKLKYLRFRNLFEVALQVINVVIISLWVSFLGAPGRNNFDVNAPQYVDLHALTVMHSSLFAWVGFQGLLYTLKTFKYLGISKQMNALWITIAASGPDLAAFSMGFVIIVSGFAIFGLYVFGSTISDFHSFGSSMSALLRMPLGDFDYKALASAAPALAGLYFALYVAIVFIICMNVFIAIVTMYFTQVRGGGAALVCMYACL